MLILLDDGCVLDTSIYRSGEYFQEEIVWNGYRHAPRCSFTAAVDSRQYVYPLGDRYYLVEITFNNKVTFARRLHAEEAAKWMMYNNHHDCMPDSLQQIARSMSQAAQVKAG